MLGLGLILNCQRPLPIGTRCLFVTCIVLTFRFRAPARVFNVLLYYTSETFFIRNFPPTYPHFGMYCGMWNGS